MKSLWNEADARRAVARWSAAGEDLALRVYTSRLIGSDPTLVLHGGGNTSVKTTIRDLDGSDLECLCVKGSGWDLGGIEPAGLPAVELAPLRRLRPLDSLTDEDMVNQVRRRLLDSKAPNPSVETLLHAFLPHRFVDHTHADAILVLTNQPDGEALVREALGAKIAVLPWIMPGFPLAKAVADAYEAQPDVEGIVLLKHGIFTFGDTARQSYERMIELVDRAERFAAARVPAPPMLQGGMCGDPAERDRFLAAALPVLRGALALERRAGDPSSNLRVVTEVRDADDLVAFSAHPDAPDLLAKGPLTPDHVIRTKGRYLFLTRDQALDPEACRAAVRDYVGWYLGYVRTSAEAAGRSGQQALVPPQPVVAVIEGVGLVATGVQLAAARVAADIAEHTLRAKAVGHGLGRYEDLPEADLYEMEYWPLELAKLGKKALLPLAGQVALVTGAAGAIGCGIADALLAAGAHLYATDVDRERLAVVLQRLEHAHGAGRTASGVHDITDPRQVRGMFDAACRAFGGVDVVVPNAGIAHVAPLAEMDPETFAKVLAVNATGTMLVLKEAARVFAAQRTGGSVVVQASKNVPAPGASFGAYSASKAAAAQLAKVAALEFAPLGVRVNTLNADAVFGDDEVASQLWATVGPDRMKARGLDPEGLRAFYRERSLLKQTVTPAHVGAAVVFFASAATPTTGAVLPVDGGVPEAFPR